ncbi:hypothetical protein [Rubrolithibacter danxiaensis]|uniref:hypothetical protein n=1 Tax=Rubrolithibacter danxiaensis TaxID=3390805 RepID=UPI003BF8B66B
MNNFEEINNYGGLFLTKLHEPSDNSLEIEVRESFTSPLSTDVVVGEKTIKDCYEVSINEYGTSFNISFINYVAYQVLNESFYSFRENENYVAGKYSTFCIFSESSYLDFVLKETYADEIFPKELRHYGLYCQNHIVHIIALNEPEITKNGSA